MFEANGRSTSPAADSVMTQQYHEGMWESWGIPLLTFVFICAKIE
jgi:hypothetical protein